MKRTLVRSILGAVLPLLILVGGVRTIVSAQSEDSNSNGRQDRIVGLWNIQTAVFNCTTGAQLASFRALHQYASGGTAVVVPSTNPAAQTTHLGVWRYVDKNQYQLDFKMFRFDATGTNIGWTVVKTDVTMNEDATEYTGSGQAELFDVNGNSLGKSCPVFAGIRFQR
jgi:hypothetical protein